MAASGGLATCSKVTLFIFNFIFWICGLGIIGVGIWMKADPYVVNQFAIIGMGEGLLTHASSIILAVGIFIMIFGFLGCCGALKESYCMLSLYAAALILVMLMQLVVGILAFVYRNRIEYSLRKSMIDQIQNDYMYENDIGRAWNFVQVRMRCCGSSGPIDYRGSKWAVATNAAVPKTCCELEWRDRRNLINVDPQNVEPRDYQKCLADGSGNSSSSLYLFTNGCYLTILEWVKQHATILIGLGLGIGLIQIIGLACAIIMIMRLRLEHMSGEKKY